MGAAGMTETSHHLGIVRPTKVITEMVAYGETPLMIAILTYFTWTSHGTIGRLR